MEIIPLIIMLHVFAGPVDLMEVCDSLGAPKAAGCAVKDGNKCNVYIMAPQLGYSQDFEVIGHELWHCYVGSFHAGDDARLVVTDETVPLP